MRYEIVPAQNGVILNEIHEPGEWEENDNGHTVTEVFEMPIYLCGSDDIDETEAEQVKGFINTVLDKLGLSYRKYSRINFELTWEEGDHYTFTKKDVPNICQKIAKLEQELKDWNEILKYAEKDQI